MAGRLSSRQLIGRGAELAVLDALTGTAAAGTARIALVAGEAGIGKTRLVRAVSDRARAKGFVVAPGGCIQLGSSSIAFAPFAEALRVLDDQGLAEGAGPPWAQPAGEVFEQVLGLLREVSRSRPVLLVIEDLHWADASTLDLVSFLGRNLTGAAVALILTYRADEITRRDPLRQVIANLERDAAVERVALTGLGRADLVILLDEIGAALPDAEEIDRLLARSGGNPFYVEELVAAGPACTGVPGRIADVVLARAAALSMQAQDALRVAAVLGDEVDDELVGAMAGHAVAGPLREAVEHGLLVHDDTSCRFRHALIREALYDDLLPGERARLHRAAADAVEPAGGIAEHTRWAMVAHHRGAAQDMPGEFAASVRAAAAAERVNAFADAADQYERALRLHDQVPDAGLTGTELRLRACGPLEAAGRAERALVLAEEVRRELGAAAAPEQQALVFERIGRINWKLNRGPAAVAAYEAGAALVADRPPSRERAYVLSALGQSLMLRQLYREALDVLRIAIEVAAETGADDVQGHALCSLGPCLVGMGRVDESIAAMRRALELSSRTGTAEECSRAYANLMSCLYAGGRYADAVVEAEPGIEYVVRSGYTRYYGDAVVGNAILSAYCAGRWDEAERLHDDPRIPSGGAYQELRWFPLLLDSGRLDEARALLPVLLDATADANDVQFRALVLLHAADLAAIDGRPDDARELVADAQVLIARTDDQLYAARAHGLAAAVATQLVIRAADRRDDAGVLAARAAADVIQDAARAFADELTARAAVPLPESAAWLVTAAAEHAAAVGAAAEAQAWSDAAAAWDEAGQPLRVATARYRQADALLRSTRDWGPATKLARAALATATAIGGEPLADQIRRLARQARLHLIDPATPKEAAPDDTAPQSRLEVTPRELEVLRLVARGRTNRQIGATLFISEKTASVHVTNLLRKLGVANRVEAAAVAARAGLD